MGTQLSLFESIKDLLYLKPLFFLGFCRDHYITVYGIQGRQNTA